MRASLRASKSPSVFPFESLGVREMLWEYEPLGEGFQQLVLVLCFYRVNKQLDYELGITIA